MITSTELLKRIKMLEIRTKHISEGIETGDFRTRFRGGGIEFSEVREYNGGDDIRRIDWNVSARYNDLFVKEFVEEKELNVYVIIDISASNDFGFKKSKKELSFEVAASLIFAALKNNDRVGMGLFSETLEKFIPAKKGKQNIIKIIHELIDYKPNNTKTDISKSLSQINKYLKRKSIVFIISDFIGDSFIQSLKLLKLNHQVVLINILDIRETEIPRIGHIYLEDSESGEQILVNTSDEQFQKKYINMVYENKKNNEHNIKKLGIDILYLSNQEPFDITFNRYFRKRRLH